jgi:hypothetical protein
MSEFEFTDMFEPAEDDSDDVLEVGVELGEMTE